MRAAVFAASVLIGSSLPLFGCEGDNRYDFDGDGWEDGVDCAPEDAAIHPDATEVCDGVDNNCDGEIDEEGTDGCTDY